MDSFQLEDVPFKIVAKHATYSIHDAVVRGKFPQLVYEAGHLNIVFIWKLEQCCLVPSKVILVDKEQRDALAPPKSEDEEEKKDPKALADVTEVVFHAPFYGMKTSGKVDTGADLSSIHATNLKVNTQTRQVSFQSDVLSDQTITMAYVEKQAVSTADGGVEYRPIINLDVSINGIKLTSMAFNLNDRSKMSHKVLIGQNILEKGKFLVDPANNSLVNKN